MARQVPSSDDNDQVLNDFDTYAPIVPNASLNLGDRTVYGTTDPSVNLSMVNIRHLNNSRSFRGRWVSDPRDTGINQGSSSGERIPYNEGQIVVGSDANGGHLYIRTANDSTNNPNPDTTSGPSTAWLQISNVDESGAEAFQASGRNYQAGNLVYRGGSTAEAGELFVYINSAAADGTTAPLPTTRQNGILRDSNWIQVGGVDLGFSSVNTQAADYNGVANAGGQGGTNAGFGGLRINNRVLEVDTDNIAIDSLGNFGGVWDPDTVNNRQQGAILIWENVVGENGLTQEAYDKWGGIWVPAANPPEAWDDVTSKPFDGINTTDADYNGPGNAGGAAGASANFGGLRVNTTDPDNHLLEVDTDQIPLDALGNLAGSWGAADVNNRARGSILKWENRVGENGLTQTAYDKWGGIWVPLADDNDVSDTRIPQWSQQIYEQNQTVRHLRRVFVSLSSGNDTIPFQSVDTTLITSQTLDGTNLTINFSSDPGVDTDNDAPHYTYVLEYMNGSETIRASFNGANIGGTPTQWVVTRTNVTFLPAPDNNNIDSVESLTSTSDEWLLVGGGSTTVVGGGGTGDTNLEIEANDTRIAGTGDSLDFRFNSAHGQANAIRGVSFEGGQYIIDFRPPAAPINFSYSAPPSLPIGTTLPDTLSYTATVSGGDQPYTYATSTTGVALNQSNGTATVTTTSLTTPINVNSAGTTTIGTVNLTDAANDTASANLQYTVTDNRRAVLRSDNIFNSRRNAFTNDIWDISLSTTNIPINALSQVSGVPTTGPYQGTTTALHSIGEVDIVVPRANLPADIPLTLSGISVRDVRTGIQQDFTPTPSSLRATLWSPLFAATNLIPTTSATIVGLTGAIDPEGPGFNRVVTISGNSAAPSGSRQWIATTLDISDTNWEISVSGQFRTLNNVTRTMVTVTYPGTTMTGTYYIYNIGPSSANDTIVRYSF